MGSYVVDKVVVQPKKNEYGWSAGVLAEDKFIWVNGDQAENICEGDTVKGILQEKPYTKDGEEKMSYKLVDEGSKAAKQALLETANKQLGETVSDLSKRLAQAEHEIKMLKDVVFPE